VGNHPGVASIFKLSSLPTNSGIPDGDLVTKSKSSIEGDILDRFILYFI
jgi:hypothetical protein